MHIVLFTLLGSECLCPSDIHKSCVTVLGGGPLGGLIPEDGALPNGISALVRDPTELPRPF